MSRKQGSGMYTWADGSTYTGQWFDNKINGYGTYLWQDGRKYFGQWNQNDMQGYGIYIYADGVRYDGQYNADKKDGYGIYYWTDGRKYEGWWSHGKQHGLGIYTDSNKKTKKFGLWEGGKRVKWFDESQIVQIQEGTYNIAANFTDPNSVAQIRTNASFQQPRAFDEQMN